MGSIAGILNGKAGSLVLVIPKGVRQAKKIQSGAKFIVKTDAARDIIYSPINSGGGLKKDGN